MRKWLLLMLFLLHGTAMATRLEVMSLQQQVVLGLPLEVEIRATGAVHSLDRLDLTAWQDKFIIRNISISSSQSTQGGMKTERMKLRLYARQVGNWRLASLQLDDAKTRPLEINVLEQKNDDVQIKFLSGLSEQQVRVRQELYMWVEVYSSSNIDVRPENFSHPYVHADEVIVQRKQLTGQAMPYLTRFTWPLLPLKQANTLVQLPLMSAGGRRLFQLEPLQLKVKPLPGFLPVSVPVSRLSLEKISVDSSLWHHQPASWKIRISGTGLSQEGLRQQLSQQLRTTADMVFYEPQITVLRSRQQPYEQQAEISISFVAEQSGSIQLPELRLACVDPASGKLSVLHIISPGLKVRHVLWYSLQVFLIGLLLAGLCVLTVYYLYLVVKRHRAWCYWYNSIALSDNPRDILQKLIHPPGDTGVLPAQTFRHWHQLNTEGGFELAESLFDVVQHLQSYAWGRGQPENFSNLKQQLLTSLPGSPWQLLNPRHRA